MENGVLHAAGTISMTENSNWDQHVSVGCKMICLVVHAKLLLDSYIVVMLLWERISLLNCMLCYAKEKRNEYRVKLHVNGHILICALSHCASRK